MTRIHATAFYGTTQYRKKVEVTFKQRFWKRRIDGFKQRYHKTVTKKVSKFVKGGERLTVFGSAKDVAEVKNKIDREQWTLFYPKIGLHFLSLKYIVAGVK